MSESSTNANGRVAVVLASINCRATLDASLSGFVREVGDRGRVIVVDASSDWSALVATEFRRGVRLIRRPPGLLAPELWREGLLAAADAEFVAFSTGQIVPRRGWLDAMLRALSGGHAAGVGGPIAPSAKLSPIDRALFLLRYANYLPPVIDEAGFEPPGDNALYRRSWLMNVADSWADGFWELNVHRRLRDRGQSLVTAPDAVVEFAGGSTRKSALGHRMAHARHFGASRASGRSLASRIGRSAAAPAVPAVLMARIARNLLHKGEPMGRWLRATPDLALLLGAWSLGEAAGGLLGPPRRAGNPA